MKEKKPNKSAFAVYLLAQLADGLFGTNWSVSPGKIPQYASVWLTGKPDSGSLGGAIAIVFLIILIYPLLAVGWLKKTKLKLNAKTEWTNVC